MIDGACQQSAMGRRGHLGPYPTCRTTYYLLMEDERVIMVTGEPTRPRLHTQLVQMTLVRLRGSQTKQKDIHVKKALEGGDDG